VSEQAQTPSPGDAPEDPLAESPAPEGTAFVQVTRRRAPRFRAFVVTGVVLAFLVAAVIAATTPPDDGYTQRALFGYLFCSLAVLFVLVGALVAVLVDRRTGTRPEPRARRSRRR
jgi:protein-S-isoprenylcysteine O-methyltransferase Ste14